MPTERARKKGQKLKTMLRRSLTVVVALTVFGALGAPAGAVDRGDLGPMTPEHREEQHEYPPLVGQYPNAERPACPPDDPAPCSVNPFAFYRPPACREATYCDTLALHVEYPDAYIRDTFFAIDVTLSWENPRTEENPNGNDVDLFLWPDDDPSSGGPSSKCGSPKENDCDNLETETITITEPSNTSKEDVEPMLFTVVNETGVNSGYTITVEWYEFTLEFEEFPEFEVPERRVTQNTSGGASGGASASGSGSSASSSGAQGVQGPDDGPRKVVVPGPDGELVEMDLPVLAAGEGLERSDAGGILTPWTWATIAAILLGTGAAFLVLHRRRRAAEGDIY